MPRKPKSHQKARDLPEGEKQTILRLIQRLDEKRPDPGVEEIRSVEDLYAWAPSGLSGFEARFLAEVSGIRLLIPPYSDPDLKTQLARWVKWYRGSAVFSSWQRQRRLLVAQEIERAKRQLQELEARRVSEKAEKASILLAKRLIKQGAIRDCPQCKGGGRQKETCDVCNGTRKAFKWVRITGAFSCRNLSPDCKFCGGTGVGSGPSPSRKKVLTDCDCENGMQTTVCTRCDGSGLVYRKNREPLSDISLVQTVKLLRKKQ